MESTNSSRTHGITFSDCLSGASVLPTLARANRRALPASSCKTLAGRRFGCEFLVTIYRQPCFRHSHLRQVTSLNASRPSVLTLELMLGELTMQPPFWLWHGIALEPSGRYSLGGGMHQARQLLSARIGSGARDRRRVAFGEREDR